MKTDIKKLYKSSIKPPRDFFKWCESHFDLITWKYKGELIQSTRVVRHRPQKQVGIRIRTSIDKHELEKSFVFRDVVDRRIETQLWKYERTFEGMKEKLSFYLLNLEIMEKGIHTKLSYCTFRNKVLPHLGLVLQNNYGMNNGYYYKTEYYDNDWVSKAKDNSDLMYLPKEYLHQHPSSLEFLFKNRMELEYCLNVRANKLFDEIMSGAADMRIVNLKWLIKNKQKIKKSDISFSELNFNGRIEERGGKVVQGIHSLIKPGQIKHIPKEIGIVKWQNWAIKKNIDMELYIDYISMLKDIGVVDKSPSTLIPGDLKVAHDNAVSILNSLEREIDESKMKSIAGKTAKFRYKGEHFSVIAPRNLNEIVIEGKELRHCVGTSEYLDKHKNGRSTILFVRENNNLEKSLYTMEYMNNRIAQCRGKFNKNTTPEVNDFLEEWKAHLIQEAKARRSKHGKQRNTSGSPYA